MLTYNLNFSIKKRHKTFLTYEFFFRFNHFGNLFSRVVIVSSYSIDDILLILSNLILDAYYQEILFVLENGLCSRLQNKIWEKGNKKYKKKKLFGKKFKSNILYCKFDYKIYNEKFS
jgi:hypothetical protein